VTQLAKQILEILNSQIEIEWLFSLVGVLTTLRQVKNLNKIIIVAKNWLDDPCANCKPNL
jgi:hypothetical protein